MGQRVPAKRYAALLRAINLGATRKVPMAALRDLLTGLGYEDVRTYVQSGNVVLTSDQKPAELERRLHKEISQQFDIDVPVLVRDHAQLANVVKNNPLPEAVTDPRRFYVVFLSGRPDAARLRAIDPAAYEPDQFRAKGAELYVWYRAGMRVSKLPQALSDARLGVTSTARNWNTVVKLLALTEK